MKILSLVTLLLLLGAPQAFAAECWYWSENYKASLSDQEPGKLPNIVSFGNMPGIGECRIVQLQDSFAAECSSKSYLFEYLLGDDGISVKAFMFDGRKFSKLCGIGGQHVNFESVLQQFDKKRPGFGLDHAKPDQPMTHDMALGFYLIAVSSEKKADLARVAAERLLEIRHKAGLDKPGWGLGFPYDAFGDGSRNPAGTVYGITTAIVVHGLFDAYDLTGEARYRDAAIEALDYVYRSSFVRSENGGGFFWYSDQEADRSQGAVLNVSAMLMGQYARAYRYTENETYRQIALRCARYIWEDRMWDSEGIKWPYRYKDGKPVAENDALHAAYIVQGFVDLAKYITPEQNFEPAVDYLARYAQTMTEGRQRLWGAGMMIFTLSDAGRKSAARKVVKDILPRFATPTGTYLYETDRPEVYLRHTAHLLAGLAMLETR